ncbi:MAG: hypothetical protein KC415_14215 [Anaerolineales bacterium]|nr:hypothetical protein [Anaerolineales bacterium]
MSTTHHRSIGKSSPRQLTTTAVSPRPLTGKTPPPTPNATKVRKCGSATHPTSATPISEFYTKAFD